MPEPTTPAPGAPQATSGTSAKPPETQAGTGLAKPQAGQLRGQTPQSTTTPTAEPKIEQVPVGGFGKTVTVAKEGGEPTSQDTGHPASNEIPVGSQNKTNDHRDQATATLPGGGLANRPGMSSH